MGSMTLDDGGTQSLASMVRALVSMSQDSMRSLLSAGILAVMEGIAPAVIFSRDWRGIDQSRDAGMGRTSRYYDSRIHS